MAGTLRTRAVRGSELGYRTTISSRMPCLICDSTGWVCESHPDRPWRGRRERADACDCGTGMPCELCNPCGGFDEPPATPVVRSDRGTVNQN
jgi:hypothetical protein